MNSSYVSAPRVAALTLLPLVALFGARVTATETDATTTASPSHETCSMHALHGGADGSTPQDMLQQFTDELGVTGQQQQDLQIIMSDYAERFRDLGELGRKSAEELMSIEPDDPTYDAKTDEVSAIAATSAAEMVILLAEMRSKIYSVLTEAQRETLRQKIDEKRQEMEQKKLELQQQDSESHDRPMDQFIQ